MCPEYYQTSMSQTLVTMKHNFYDLWQNKIKVKQEHHMVCETLLLWGGHLVQLGQGQKVVNADVI